MEYPSQAELVAIYNKRMRGLIHADNKTAPLSLWLAGNQIEFIGKLAEAVPNSNKGFVKMMQNNLRPSDIEPDIQRVLDSSKPEVKKTLDLKTQFAIAKNEDRERKIKLTDTVQYQNLKPAQRRLYVKIDKSLNQTKAGNIDYEIGSRLNYTKRLDRVPEIRYKPWKAKVRAGTKPKDFLYNGKRATKAQVQARLKAKQPRKKEA